MRARAGEELAVIGDGFVRVQEEGLQPRVSILLYIAGIGERPGLVLGEAPGESAASASDVVVPSDGAERRVLKRDRKMWIRPPVQRFQSGERVCHSPGRASRERRRLGFRASGELYFSALAAVGRGAIYGRPSDGSSSSVKERTRWLPCDFLLATGGCRPSDRRGSCSSRFCCAGRARSTSDGGSRPTCLDHSRPRFPRCSSTRCRNRIRRRSCACSSRATCLPASLRLHEHLPPALDWWHRSEEHTSELQSRQY